MPKLTVLNSQFCLRDVTKLKAIPNFENYLISECGDIYSTCRGKIHQMKPWADSRNLYVQIGLSKNGKVYKKLIHRLVAETYIPNPYNLPEVNHKDRNTQNNCVNNLEWCTRRENLYQSYKTLSPVRNYISCDLFAYGNYINTFISKTKACEYAAQTYKISKTMLQKYGHNKGIEIVSKV